MLFGLAGLTFEVKGCNPELSSAIAKTVLTSEPQASWPKVTITIVDRPPKPLRISASDDGWSFSFDPQTLGGTAWFSDGPLDVHHIATPLRLFVAWALEATGRALVHAAAVAHNGNAVMLSATQGRGKSTLSAKCAAQGMGFLGDDWVALEETDKGWIVLPVYRSLKLKDNAKLPADFAPAQIAHPTKHVYTIRNALTVPQALSAIVVPNVDPMIGVSLSRITPATALREIAPSTCLQLPQSSGVSLSVLARAVQQHDCYALNVGSMGNAVPDLMKSLLEDRCK